MSFPGSSPSDMSLIMCEFPSVMHLMSGAFQTGAAYQDHSGSVAPLRVLMLQVVFAQAAALQRDDSLRQEEQQAKLPRKSRNWNRRQSEKSAKTEQDAQGLALHKFPTAWTGQQRRCRSCVRSWQPRGSSTWRHMQQTGRWALAAPKSPEHGSSCRKGARYLLSPKPSKHWRMRTSPTSAQLLLDQVCHIRPSHLSLLICFRHLSPGRT